MRRLCEFRKTFGLVLIPSEYPQALTNFEGLSSSEMLDRCIRALIVAFVDRKKCFIQVQITVKFKT